MPVLKGLASAASKLAPAATSVLQFAAKSPMISETVAGAGAGFVTSGFSGYGALAGGAMGLIGGSMGSTRGATQFTKKSPVPTPSVVGKSLTRPRAGAPPATMMQSMPYGRTVPGTLGPGQTIGYAKTMPGSAIGYAKTMSGTMMQAGTETIGYARTMPGGRAQSASQSIGFARTMAQSTGRAATMPGTMAAARPMPGARKKTMTGGWGAGMGTTTSTDTDKVRSMIAESMGHYEKSMTTWQAGRRKAAFVGRMKGAAIGGAIGGATALGLSTVGSAFGSNNRQPYGTTFSGMGNGTAGRY
jgi:hypothetical protein